MLGLTTLPYWDRREDDIGVYFRSAAGRWAAIAGGLLSLITVPVLVMVDELWLDLPSLLPTWPTLLSNGLIPLLISLAGLLLFYAGFRLFQANHSEALVGVFTYVMVSLLVLTVIGVVFRGPNMALIWPF